MEKHVNAFHSVLIYLVYKSDTNLFTIQKPMMDVFLLYESW